MADSTFKYFSNHSVVIHYDLEHGRFHQISNVHVLAQPISDMDPISAVSVL